MSQKSAIVVSEPVGDVRRQILLRVIRRRGGNVLDLRDCYKVSLADFTTATSNALPKVGPCGLQ